MCCDCGMESPPPHLSVSVSRAGGPGRPRVVSMNKANLSVASAAWAGLSAWWRRQVGFRALEWPSALWDLAHWTQAQEWLPGPRLMRLLFAPAQDLEGRGGSPLGWDAQLTGRRKGGSRRHLLGCNAITGGSRPWEAQRRKGRGTRVHVGRPSRANPRVRTPASSHVHTRADTSALLAAHAPRRSLQKSAVLLHAELFPLQNAYTCRPSPTPAQSRTIRQRGVEVGQCSRRGQSSGMQCSTPPRRAPESLSSPRNGSADIQEGVQEP